MTYTIILKNGEAFETNWYDYHNIWSDDIFMVIKGNQYSTNGIDFKVMEEDHL